MKACNVFGVVAVAIMLAVSAAALADGDAAAGGQKTAMCQGCHGIPGYKTVFPSVYNVPKLGRQHAGYLAKALHAYKSGARKNPIMSGQVTALKKEDIADLAAYYASQPALVMKY